MTTALELLTGSLKLLGVVTKTKPISADEAEDGLGRLNELLESWANDTLLAYTRVWESFPLSAGVGSYTIGTGQTFNTARPVSIVSAYVRNQTTDYPLMMIRDEDYARIDTKSTTSQTPQYLNYDQGFPVGTIRLWEVPSAGLTLYMQSEKVLTSFADLSSDVSLPPGWAKALRYALAIDLAPEYGIAVSGEVANQAAESKYLLKSQAEQGRPILLNTWGQTSYNGYTGRYY